MLPLAAVQKSLFDALTAALAPVPVLDFAGPNQSYPYCTIGEFTGGQSDTIGEQAVDLEVTVHLWSRQPGMQEVQTLMETAKDALDRARLPAAGFHWVDTIFIFAQTLRDIDGQTRHGVLRFRILTFEAESLSRFVLNS